MSKAANCALLLLLVVAVSCRSSIPTEKEDTAYWKHSFVDSAFSLLYKEKDTVRALSYFDSALQYAHPASVYPKAARFDLKAQYY